ncbi:lipopolysaccharide biosynthesis protein [Massilia rubra]|uniref:Oligosaccharide flippase family protein n=1 Tax=Massilia rubra TaxID=2607910 RepID=A0ABX0LNE6_9BURK|nr:oligosaccharide flippase family protein [Massilia rubra]NHZ36401.1 oligosaccharide flippase family protein [Massilia rubra]
MTGASLKRGAITLTAANMLDFGLQFLMPIALVRLLPTSAFADYRLAWLAIGTAMAIAPFALPRSLFYFLPRHEGQARAPYVHQTLLMLLLTGALAGLALGPWNPLLPASLRAMHSAAWFMPAFLTLWVAANLIEFLPNARGDVAGQAKTIVALAVLRVVMVAAAAWSGRADVVFGALVAYAAIKVLLVLLHIGRHYGWRVFPLQMPVLRTQLVYCVPFGLASALFLLRGQADQWVAAAMFPAAAFAAFSIGAVIMPVVALVRNSVSNAIAPRLSALESNKDQDGMLRLNQRANLASAYVLLPTLMLTAVLAVHIVTVVYTDKYLLAADVMRINCLALLGVAVEVSTLTVVLNQGRFLLAADGCLLFVSLAAGVTGALLFGIPGAALGNVVTLAAGNAFSFWRVSRVTGVPLRRLQQWGALLRILAACVGAGALAALLDAANLVRIVWLEAVLIGVVFAVAYAVLLKLAGALAEARALFLPQPAAKAASPAPPASPIQKHD